jgi:hypothetical protein
LYNNKHIGVHSQTVCKKVGDGQVKSATYHHTNTNTNTTTTMMTPKFFHSYGINLFLFASLNFLFDML